MAYGAATGVAFVRMSARRGLPECSLSASRGHYLLMAPAFAVFLIVTFQWPGEDAWTKETKQPDLVTCMVRASRILEQAATVHSEDPYRVSARCMVEWPGHDPA